MQRLLFFFLISAFVPGQEAKAPYDALRLLKNDSIQVYYSAGHEQRAVLIAERTGKAMGYYEQLLGFKPTVTLLLLAASDWATFTSFPVYGMPHYNDNKTLIVAAEDNAFWKSFLPPAEKLPGELREQVQAVYTNENGETSMRPFFDLLALHELGHAFHLQGGLTMQRKWMGELFVNILLHTYIARNEPSALPALTLFPRMVINNGAAEFAYTTLNDIEERYEEIGKQHPKNYGWYQSRWHSAAATIYDTDGKEVGRKLWDAFKNESVKLADSGLLSLLEAAGAKTVAAMMRNWDMNTIR
ncbi:MAG: hypothetical protein JNK14_13255 [Chitinophagaceae bacterium]|nr:hypothetical protein [Chitinophagaceae bacterium]